MQKAVIVMSHSKVYNASILKKDGMPKPNKSNCHLHFTKIFKIFNMFSSNNISYIEQVLSLSRQALINAK